MNASPFNGLGTFPLAAPAMLAIALSPKHDLRLPACRGKRNKNITTPELEWSRKTRPDNLNTELCCSCSRGLFRLPQEGEGSGSSPSPAPRCRRCTPRCGERGGEAKRSSVTARRGRGVGARVAHSPRDCRRSQSAAGGRPLFPPSASPRPAPCAAAPACLPARCGDQLLRPPGCLAAPPCGCWLLGCCSAPWAPVSSRRLLSPSLVVPSPVAGVAVAGPETRPVRPRLQRSSGAGAPPAAEVPAARRRGAREGVRL